MVTYVLDAQSSSFWNMAKNNIAYLVDNYQAVPMIIVGIHAINRHSEFIPLPKDRAIDENTPGTAHLLHKHFEEEIFPLIEENYRVNQHRALIGHSRGGGFVNHTLFSNKFQMFNAYIAISPALGYWNNQILNDADSILKHRTEFNKFLYASHGDVGSYEYNFKNQVEHLDSLISKTNNNTLGWYKEYIKETDHWSTVGPSINKAMVKMSREYWVDQKILEEFANNADLKFKPQIKAFYKEKQEKYKYTVLPDERILLFIGNDFGELGNELRALETYEWGLELDPSNVSLNKNVAWVHKKNRRYTKAINYYEKALLSLEKIKNDMEEERYSQIKSDIKSNIIKTEKARETNINIKN
jgi:predicted alpha/beta superfamily hydrolase